MKNKKTYRLFHVIAGISLLIFILLAAGCGMTGSGAGDTGSAALKPAVTSSAAPVTGSIFTSTSGGTTVNGNIYDLKADVYLNGGPPPNAPCSAAGLPDGAYYFQVTDPSGKVLLSSDDISNRQFTVAGGVIMSAATHATGLGKCPGAISVQLMPYDDTPNPGGEYKVWATPQTDYGDPADGATVFGFMPSKSKTDNFKVRENATVPPPLSGLYGMKYYDTNANGVFDAGDAPLAGWKIELVPGPIDTFTSADGQYSFLVDPGLYTVSEIFPLSSTWHSVDSITSVEVEVISGLTHAADFGNVCWGPGGGLTLGFWSNKNGQARIGADDLALLVGLHLRDGLGNDFDPASYSAFRSWILSATAVNMAYMLSAQLAAMELNVHNFDGVFGVDGSSLIYAPGTSSANLFGYATVDAVMAEADMELGLHGLTLDGSPFGAYQEALKNALDKANNNLTFAVSPSNPDFSTLCPIAY